MFLGWSYVFVVLHCLNFFNGAIGALLAIIGIALTTSISCNRKMNVVLRVLLNVAIVIISVIVVFGIAFLIAGI